MTPPEKKKIMIGGGILAALGLGGLAAWKWGPWGKSSAGAPPAGPDIPASPPVASSPPASSAPEGSDAAAPDDGAPAAAGETVSGTDDGGASIEGVVLSFTERTPGIIVYEIRDRFGRIHHLPRHRFRRHHHHGGGPLVLREAWHGHAYGHAERERHERERRERERRERERAEHARLERERRERERGHK